MTQGQDLQMFKAATVTSGAPFSRDAGRHLGESLVQQLGSSPDGCLLFCSPEENLGDMVRGVCEAVGTGNLVGCTSAGEISSEGYSQHSAVLGGFASDQFDVHMACVNDIGLDSEGAGEKLAAAFPPTVRFVQLFSDALEGNGCAVLRGMQRVLGDSIIIAGGAAADNMQFSRTLQFSGPQVHTRAAVAMGFSGSFSVGMGVSSGWSPIGIAKRVTRAEGNVLYELNHQPALEVYKRFLGKHVDKLPAVGAEYALGLVDHHGFMGREDYCLMRASLAVNHEDGSIMYGGEVPEGAMVRFSCCDSNSLLEAAAEACRAALSDLARNTPVMAFLYSCLARKVMLGRRTDEEWRIVRQELGRNIPILGFYTFGEYGRAKAGMPSVLHNQTAAVAILGV